MTLPHVVLEHDDGRLLLAVYYTLSVVIVAIGPIRSTRSWTLVSTTVPRPRSSPSTPLRNVRRTIRRSTMPAGPRCSPRSDSQPQRRLWSVMIMIRCSR